MNVGVIFKSDQAFRRALSMCSPRYINVYDLGHGALAYGPPWTSPNAANVVVTSKPIYRIVVHAK